MNQPTINQLYNNITSDFKTNFGISSENDLKRVLTAISSTQAATLKMLYLLLKDIQTNIFVDTAYPESEGGTLERFGRIKLGREPYKATQGIYLLDVTGVIGGVIKEGSQYKTGANSSSPNQLYEVTTDYTLTATTGQVEVKSILEGLDYQINPLDELFLVNPIVNVDDLAIVDSIVEEPIAAETIEEYRALAELAYRVEANGGSVGDYKLWALDVVGLRTIYPYTKIGESGTATIYAEAIVDYSTDGFGTPSITILDALWKNNFTGVFEIDPDTSKTEYERARRQLGLSNIEILPITPNEITVIITNLIDQSDVVVAAILESVKKYFYSIRPYIVGFDNPITKIDTLTSSGLIQSIANATSIGNTFESVSIIGDVATMPYTFMNGDIPVLKEIIYN